MAQSKNASKLNSNLNWCYFDVSSNNHNCFVLDHTFIIDVAQSTSTVASIMSMTKFDSSETVEQ